VLGPAGRGRVGLRMWSRMLLTVGRVHRVQIRVHFTMVLALALACLDMNLAGVVVGYSALVLLHELGHAVVVRAVGARVTAIDLAPIAGMCHWEGQVSPLRRSLVAWGGVAAQLVVLYYASRFAQTMAITPRSFLDGLIWALTAANAGAILLNLMPAPPLDGAEAWPLFPRALRWLRKRTRARAAAAPPATDRALDAHEVPDEMKRVVDKMLHDAAKRARDEARRRD